MGRQYSNTIMVGSPMLAADVSQLRTFIDQDIAAAGLSPHPWTWGNVVSGDPVLAVQFREMRAAIQRLWDFKARGPLPMWSSGAEPGGPSVGAAATPIFASDLTDLRTWLNQYEDNHPPSDQSIDSFSFDPTDGRRPIITDAWAQDIKDLALEKPLFVRANVKARSDNTIPEEDLIQYRLACNRYRNKGLRVFALFSSEFDLIGPAGDPKDPLEEDFANSYIRHFSNRAAAISADLNANAGVEDYIIWNEPNDEGAPIKQLDEAHFAALLYHCWQKMTAVPRMYMGGVIFGPGYEDQPDQNALDYLRTTYQVLFDQGLAGGEFGAWPWSGVNIHIHRDRSTNQLNAIFQGVKDIMVDFGESGELVVGEWGVTQEDQAADPNRISHLFNGIKPNASMMFFFKHGNFEEVPPPDPITWGIHMFAINVGEYVITDAPGGTNLHGPLDSLLGP